MLYILFYLFLKLTYAVLSSRPTKKLKENEAIDAEECLRRNPSFVYKSPEDRGVSFPQSYEVFAEFFFFCLLHNVNLI